MRHPKYRFLEVSRSGEIIDTIHNTSLKVEQGPFKYPYIEMDCGYKFYLYDLLADCYMDIPEGYTRYMVRPVLKKGISGFKTIDDLEWMYLAKIEDNEIRWNPIRTMLVDLLSPTSSPVEEAIHRFDSKADMSRWFQNKGKTPPKYNYGPDSWSKLSQGRYMIFRDGYDGMPDLWKITSRYIYLVKTSGMNPVFVRIANKSELMQKERCPEQFEQDDVVAAYYELAVREGNDKHPISMINNDYGLIYCKDYLKNYSNYNRIKMEVDKDIPF